MASIAKNPNPVPSSVLSYPHPSLPSKVISNISGSVHGWKTERCHLQLSELGCIFPSDAAHIDSCLLPGERWAPFPLCKGSGSVIWHQSLLKAHRIPGSIHQEYSHKNTKGSCQFQEEMKVSSQLQSWWATFVDSQGPSEGDGWYAGTEKGGAMILGWWPC